MVIKFICDFIVDASFLYLVDSGYIKAMANKRVDMSKESDDYDSPWKKILEAYFKEFVVFFFPAAAEGVSGGQTLIISLSFL